MLNGQIFLSTISYSDDSVVWLVKFLNDYFVVIGVICGLDMMVAILWVLLR
jgi:hypothetical protein